MRSFDAENTEKNRERRAQANLPLGVLGLLGDLGDLGVERALHSAQAAR
jgi:hypothetical protein